MNDGVKLKKVRFAVALLSCELRIFIGAALPCRADLMPMFLALVFHLSYGSLTDADLQSVVGCISRYFTDDSYGLHVLILYVIMLY